jgi:hypothetical protein
MVLLLELPLCRETLEKKFSFAMWPLGRPGEVAAAARGGGRRGCRFPARAARGRLRAARLAWVGARGGEELASFAGAARDWSFAGARPWTRWRAAGHRFSADMGSTFNRGTTSWRAHGHQGVPGPKASACVRDRGAHRGDHRSDGGPFGRSGVAYGRHIARGGEDFKGPSGVWRLGKLGARTPRLFGARAGATSVWRRAPARRRVVASARERRAHFMCRTGSVWPRFAQKSWIVVHKVMNMKVVDLTILYNFHKGRTVFFSTDFAGTSCQLGMPACPCEHEVLINRSSFSPISTQNLQCQSTWKLCPSTRWTTFIKVDFEVFRWNLENAAKVPDDIRWRQWLSRFWPCLWPRVDYGCV